MVANASALGTVARQKWPRSLGGSGPPPFQALRTTRWLYVEYQNGWRELYDLRRDPYELLNVVRDPAHAAVRATLARRLHTVNGA